MPEFRVLIPLDGSRVAEHALIYIDALRALGESQVRLLSVVDESEDFRAMETAEAKERETNLLSTYLREVASDIRQHIGVEVDTKVVCGMPATCVLQEALEYRPNLLVISTHGRTGATRWRLGSVADKVIRGADCDVLAIGPKATANEVWLDARIMPPFRSIMVPLDGSALAEEALTVALNMAETFGSTLHVVRTVAIPTMAVGYGAEIAYTPQILEGLVEGAEEYLKLTSERAGPSTKLVSEVLIGPAEVQLADYAEAKAIDLIVMTTHGRGGIVRTALGSVTDRLLGGSCPVLVVRATGEAQA